MKEAPPYSDLQAGMSVYATEGPTNDARIRVMLEDFAVEELIELGKEGGGPYPVYRVEKRGMDTIQAAGILERVLRGRVSFAGLKDKRSVAVQYMSPTSVRSASPREVTDRGLRAERLGYFASPVRRGMMIGNRFRVSVRSTAPRIEGSVLEAFSKCNRRELPNFFGYQRFGLKADINRTVGKAIVRGDFAQGVALLVGGERVGEMAHAADARKLFREGKYREALEIFSEHHYLEARVLSRLVSKSDDPLRALRTLPIALRKLFVNAYQAYIYNKVLSAAVEQGLDLSTATPGDNWARIGPDKLRVGKPHGVGEEPAEGSLPLVQLVGYAFRDYGSRFDRLVLDQLGVEGIEPKQFYVKEAEEMSSEGGFRHAPLIARDPEYRRDPDGLLLDFSLARGEYATTLLREIIKPRNPLEAGF